MKKQVVVLVLAAVLVFGCAVGGTLAWLSAKTQTITNTFTYGDINITLTETPRDYKMIPGETLDKNPAVTVINDSEACWLFVKIEKSANLDTFISYNVDSAWTALPGHDGVYYIDQNAVPAGEENNVTYPVLDDNKVTVKDVTKAQLNGLETAETQPELSFTAYAVQKSGLDSVVDAWNVAMQLDPPANP